jgi:hypothetical protein
MPAGAAPPESQVRIVETSVADDRRTQNSSLTVRLDLQSPLFTPARGLRATLKTAEDETGRDLIDTKPFAFSAYADDFEAIGKSDRADVDLRLASPPRQVTRVRQISGELEIYTPSKDPASVLFIKNIAQQSDTQRSNAPRSNVPRSNAPLVSPTLQKAGVSITIWTKEHYARYRQEEIKKKGPGEALSQGFGDLLGQMFGGGGDDKNNLVLYIKDPALRLVKISIVDASGQPVRSRGTLRMGTGKERRETFQLDAKLPASSRLKIEVATPKSVVKVPFQVRDIELP